MAIKEEKNYLYDVFSQFRWTKKVGIKVYITDALLVLLVSVVAL